MNNPKKTSAVILVTLLLASCYSSANNQGSKYENDKELDDNFARKVECQKYLNDVQKKLQEKYEFTSNSMTFFKKLYYSKKANSCLYRWEEEMWIKDKRSMDAFHLTDALTGEDIVYVTATWGNPDYYERKNKFDEEVKSYEE